MISEKVRIIECENERLKEENEELKRILGTEPPKPMNCKECVFFIQHYVKAGCQYVKTNAGHCVHGIRMKDRKAEEKKCQYFEFGRYR